GSLGGGASAHRDRGFAGDLRHPSDQPGATDLSRAAAGRGDRAGTGEPRGTALRLGGDPVGGTRLPLDRLGASARSRGARDARLHRPRQPARLLTAHDLPGRVDRSRDPRGRAAELPQRTSRARIPAVFAVSAGNYQRATSPSPQKPWSSSGAAQARTAGAGGPARCILTEMMCRGRRWDAMNSYRLVPFWYIAII